VNMNHLLSLTVIAPILAMAPAMQTRPGSSPAPSTPSSQDAAAPYHLITKFEVGGDGRWDYVSLDSTARRLYVPRSTRVMVLDADSGAVVGEIPDTAGVHGVAVASPVGKGFASNGGADTVTAFDLKTLKVIQTVKTGKNPDAIAFEPKTKRVFAFNGRSSDATVINADDLSVVGTIALGGKPEFAVVDGAGKLFVNIEDTSELVRIDAQSMKVEKRFPLAPGEEPSGLAIDPTHHRLFSVCANQKMIITDSETGKVLASPPIGKGVDGAAFDMASGCALSSNGEGNISVIATNEGEKQFTVIQTLTTAQGARTMTIDPKTRRIYLPTAEFEPPPASRPEGGRSRPAMKAGTFRIIVAGP